MADNSIFEGNLPTGFELLNCLVGAGAFGDVLATLDCRCGSQVSVRRIVRILPKPGEADWQSQIVDHATKLAILNLPFVSLPLEVGFTDDRRVYIVCAQYDTNLHAVLGERKGLPLEKVEPFLRQLFTGLAGLHNHGIAHGDVRSRNVFLCDKKLYQTAWLIDAAIGQLAFQSRNELCDPDAKRYYQPEWNGLTEAPTFEADLYALGLVTCEMFLGNGFQHSVWGATKAALRNAGVKTTTRELLERMLSPTPATRFKDADTALNAWDESLRRNARNNWSFAGLMAIAALLVLLVYGWHQSAKIIVSETNAANSQDDIGKGKIELESVKNKLAIAIADSSSQKEEIKRLKEQLAKLTPPSPLGKTPEQVAQDKWTTVTGGKSMPIEILDAVEKQLEKPLAGEPGKKFKEYYAAARTFIRKDALRWLNHDPNGSIDSLLNSFARTPWNEHTKQKLEQRLKDLKSAEETWERWIRDDLSWEKINDRVAADQNEVNKILESWLNKIKDKSEFADGWRILLKDGIAPNGWGNDRLLTISAGYASPVNWHKWKAETGHTYDSATETFACQVFSLKPGAPFRVTMVKSINYLGYHAVLVDKTFTGPLAVWKAHKQRTIVDPNGCVLNFEIEDCPGPPVTRLPTPSSVMSLPLPAKQGNNE